MAGARTCRRAHGETLHESPTVAGPGLGHAAPRLSLGHRVCELPVALLRRSSERAAQDGGVEARVLGSPQHGGARRSVVLICVRSLTAVGPEGARRGGRSHLCPHEAGGAGLTHRGPVRPPRVGEGPRGVRASPAGDAAFAAQLR